jgi:hypothetical protein
LLPDLYGRDERSNIDKMWSCFLQELHWKSTGCPEEVPYLQDEMYSEIHLQDLSSCISLKIPLFVSVDFDLT